MKTVFVLALATALAGCSQTATEEAAKPNTRAQPSAAEAPAAKSASATAASRDACDKAVQQQMNAAAVGGALGMVGGFGGFGSHGGAVAAHVASSAGSMIAHQQAEKQRAEIERNCY